MYAPFHKIKFALAAASTLTLAQIIGRLFMHFSMLRMRNAPYYMQRPHFMQQPYLLPYMLGELLFAFISSLIIAWFFAWLYNWLLERQS